MTTYDDILAGFAERFATLSGLAGVLDYEPTAVSDTPLLYSLIDGWTTEAQGQVTKHTWRTLHRVVVSWQDPQGAETALRPFLSSLPAAIAADPRLGNRLPRGYARIVDMTAVFVVIGSVLCRAYDFTSEVFTK